MSLKYSNKFGANASDSQTQISRKEIIVEPPKILPHSIHQSANQSFSLLNNLSRAEPAPQLQAEFITEQLGPTQSARFSTQAILERSQQRI